MSRLFSVLLQAPRPAISKKPKTPRRRNAP